MKENNGNKELRTIVSPSYYGEFSCIADQCSFTCCKEWNIAVDSQTYHDWKGTCHEGMDLTSYTVPKEGTHAMKLNSEKRCPFLADNELCRLVMQHGEDVLSDTCATFPRQIHEYDDRIEASLVSCCPEVIDIMSRQDRIDIDAQDKAGVIKLEEWQQSPLARLRGTIMNIIQNPVLDMNMELMIIFEVMLGILDNKGATDQELRQCESDDYLKRMAADISTMDFDEVETFLEGNELYLDLVDNYKKEGFYKEQLKDVVGLAEKIEQGYMEEQLPEILKEFKEHFQKYDKLFRNYIAAEFFTNAIVPDCSLESMVVMVQWISLQYVAMRQDIFLNWMLNKSDIEYEDVRTSIVLISRITGYDQKDIFEYLDSSFQSRIWEWGYEALIVGK